MLRHHRRDLSHPARTNQECSGFKPSDYGKDRKRSNSIVDRTNTSINNEYKGKNTNNDLKLWPAQQRLYKSKSPGAPSMEVLRSGQSSRASHTVPDHSETTGLSYSTYSTESTEDVDVIPASAKHSDEFDKALDGILEHDGALMNDDEPDVEEGVPTDQQEVDTVGDAETNFKPNPAMDDPVVERKRSRGFRLGKRVRNAWMLAKSSKKNDSMNINKKHSSDREYRSPKFQVPETRDKGDQLRTPIGHLQPWQPVANQTQTSPQRSRSSEEIPTATPQLLLKNHSETLMNSLKEATLQLARRDMEMQRLIAVNAQLGERYCRMRAQYTDLAREQARLRQRYDMLIVKGMDREQLRQTNHQLETQIADLQAKLARAEERANQSTRRLGRVEAEAKDIAHTVNSADVQLANLRVELQRKDAQIRALTSRQFMDATREMQARSMLNELIELKGNIRVLIRCRETENEDSVIRFFGDDTLVVKPHACVSPGQPNRQMPTTFKAYRVFPPGVAQRAVFEEISELVTACVDGYGVSIITYGQTGTGKTYTMLGAPNKPGIIPRATRHLLTQCQQRAPLWTYRISISVVQVYKETIIDLLADPLQPMTRQQLGRISLHDNGRQILLRSCKEVEVHTEEEILDEVRKARIRRQSSAALLNTSPSYLHFIVILRVRGASMLSSHGWELYEKGRRQCKPRFNDGQSHSPIPFGTRATANKSDAFGGVGAAGGGEYTDANNTQLLTHGLLMLCDLAGFDTWNPSQVPQLDSQTQPQQQQQQQPRQSTVHAQPNDVVRSANRPQESRPVVSGGTTQNDMEHRISQPAIRSAGLVIHPFPQLTSEAEALENKHLGRSLVTFARVIDALVDSETNPKIHIPYRDTKLTHLLKPCLTGDSKCMLIVTLNNQKACLEATMRSLKLASKASLIALGQAKKNATLRCGIRAAT